MDDDDELSIDRTGPDFLLEELDASYLGRPDFADVQVVAAGGRSFLAHCAVLAPLSPFLRSILLRHAAAEHPLTVMMPDVAAEEVEALLKLAYSGEAMGTGDGRAMRATLRTLRARKDIRIEGLDDDDNDDDDEHHNGDEGGFEEEEEGADDEIFLPDEEERKRPMAIQPLQSPQLKKPRLLQQRGAQAKQVQRVPQLFHLKLPPSIVASLKPVPPPVRSSATALRQPPPPPPPLQRKRPHPQHHLSSQTRAAASATATTVGSSDAGLLLPEIARRLTEQHPQISIQPSRRTLDRRTREMLDQTDWDRAAGRKCDKCRCPNCVQQDGTGAAGAGAGDPPRTHVCHYPDCGRAYKKTSHLRSHLRAHIGDQPYACSWKGCDRRFTRSDELHRHFRIHTGERNHRCNRCAKSFSRADHLKKHLVSHVGEVDAAAGAEQGQGYQFVVEGEVEGEQEEEEEEGEEEPITVMPAF